MDFYARQAGLVIEVDGDQIHGTKEQQEYDQMRDEWMKSLGMRVLRYLASDIFMNISEVLDDITFWCGEYIPRSRPEYQWCYVENLRVGDSIIKGTNFSHHTIQTIQTKLFQSKLFQIELDPPEGIRSEQCIIAGTNPP